MAEEKRNALVNVQHRRLARPMSWLFTQTDRFRAGDWLIVDDVDPHLPVPITQWPRGRCVLDTAFMVYAMLASWAVQVPWRDTQPVNPRKAAAIRRGIDAQMQAWYASLTSAFSDEHTDMAKRAREIVVADQFSSRFRNVRSIKTYSANTPRLWFAELVDGAPADLRVLNAGRREVAIKAQPFPSDMDEMRALINGIDNNMRRFVMEGLDTGTPVLFTVDVLFGLLFRDMLLLDTGGAVLTPHIAVALDAFIGFEVLGDKLNTVSPPKLCMYQVTERGDFTLYQYLTGQAKDERRSSVPFNVDAFRGLIWQALFTVYVLARKHGIYHRDAHPGNIMGRRLPPDSPLYGRPWLYVLPPLDTSWSSPRYFVLEPEMHGNLFCMIIDFDATRFLPSGTTNNWRDLRWDLQRVLYGHRDDDPFYDPLLVDADTAFPFGSGAYDPSLMDAAATPIIMQMTRDTRDLCRRDLDVDNWPVLLGMPRATVHRVDDLDELARRYPSAVAVGAFPQYPSEDYTATPPSPRASVPDDDDVTDSSGTAPKRDREWHPSESPQPPKKRPRLQHQCLVCGGPSPVSCSAFCRAIEGRQLSVARPLRVRTDGHCIRV